MSCVFVCYFLLERRRGIDGVCVCVCSVIKLILQFLKEQNLNKTALALQVGSSFSLSQ